ncbi:MAG: hypothetical protein IJ446_05670 [Oscillospiraceae bacterium]|nr:hypothetical protein [Oscillospiraceae bacterium]
MLKFGSDNECFEGAPFIIGISDDNNNRLSIKISAAVKGENDCGDKTDCEELDKILSSAYPICPDEDNVYEIIFERYILYLTRNESYCASDEHDIWEGRFLIKYSRSALLDILPVLTECQKLSDGTFYPGEWKHFGISSQNHTVDIITEYDPLIIPCRKASGVDF